MAEPEKKLVFGFSKIAKKSNLVRPPPPTKDKSNGVQFIDSIEEKSIKLKDGDEKETGPLVIPLVGPRKSSTLINGKSIAELVEDFSEIDKRSAQAQQHVPQSGMETSLDAIAAREILQEALETKVEERQTLELLPTAENVKIEELQKESTLEDYENIPVSQFGLAMLRGMGWKPGEGIGKNQQVVPVSAPVVRPKGLGLGAEKVIASSSAPGPSSNKTDKDDLKVVKGAYVKVLGGSQKGQYAQVEGFTDDSGRAILKMAIGGHTVSVNEASICPVSKTEYSKNSKVLNAHKFEEFKKNEGEESTPEKGLSRNTEQTTTKQKPSHRPSSPQPWRKSSTQTYESSKYSEREHTLSRNPRVQAPISIKKNDSDSSSESPERLEDRRRYRSRSRSPSYKRSGGKRDSHKSRSISSPRRENRGSSRSRIVSYDRSKIRKAYSSDSEDSGNSSRRKRDKDSHKTQRHSSSDSGDLPSYKSQRKKKGKKCRRSHSRSPNRRRRK